MRLPHQSPSPVSLAAANHSSGAATLQIAARPDPLFHLVILVLCVGILALAITLSVRDQTQVVVPMIGKPLPELCLLRRTTGLTCPGCGLTRCFIALAHGDAASAWSYNPAGILLFGIVAAQPPFRALQLWRIRRRLPELSMSLIPHVLLVAFVIALFTQWALRGLGVSL